MFNEITQKAIKAAFEKPTQVNANLVDAQQALASLMVVALKYILGAVACLCIHSFRFPVSDSATGSSRICSGMA